MDVVGEGGSCEKDLRLVGREFHRRGEEFLKGRSDNVSLEMRVRRERWWSEKRVLSAGLMVVS